MIKRSISIAIFMISVVVLAPENSAQAAATLSLTSSASPVTPGQNFTVDVDMNTGGAAVVVARATIRYNPVYLTFNSWITSASAFSANSGNTCYTASAVGKSANTPCKIESNDATYGIASIILATPHQAPVNGNPKRVATASFTVKSGGSVPGSIITLDAMGLQFISATSYSDSDVIADDSSGTELLSSVNISSTVTSGDLNADRTVDIYDYNILHTNWGNTACGNPADIDGAIDAATGECAIGIYDYNAVHTNWNRMDL